MGWQRGLEASGGFDLNPTKKHPVPDLRYAEISHQEPKLDDAESPSQRFEDHVIDASVECRVQQARYVLGNERGWIEFQDRRRRARKPCQGRRQKTGTQQQISTLFPNF